MIFIYLLTSIFLLILLEHQVFLPHLGQVNFLFFNVCNPKV